MIVLIGPLGAGKTEQGRQLAAHLNCPWLSTGQLLRDHPSPQRVERMQRGELVDDRDVLDLLEEQLAKIGADQNECVLDGSPRTTHQAEWLIKKIEAGEIKLTAVIQLKVPHEAVLKRLAHRGRPDDRPEVIERRLEDYDHHTVPALNYLRDHGLQIHEIDGLKSRDAVQAEILKVVDEAR